MPVSLRTEEERGMLGNRLAVFRAPLPVYAEDPVERLRIVREEMCEGQAVEAGDGRARRSSR